VNAGTKLGAYTLLLAAVFGAAAAVGAAVGPIDVGGAPAAEVHDPDEHPATSGHADPGDD
jgi:hypothetical protein